ncbi:hypothetical protein WJX82_002921 [Trebouxia sp. C0006]
MRRPIGCCGVWLLRGTKLKGNARVHIAGVGDATVEGLLPSYSQDPSAVVLGATDANAIALPGPPSASAPPPGVAFTPAAAFSGVKYCCP